MMKEDVLSEGSINMHLPLSSTYRFLKRHPSAMMGGMGGRVDGGGEGVGGDEGEECDWRPRKP